MGRKHKNHNPVDFTGRWLIKIEAGLFKDGQNRDLNGYLRVILHTRQNVKIAIRLKMPYPATPIWFFYSLLFSSISC